MTTYQQLAATYAQQNGIDPTVFVAQIQQESGFQTNVVSPAGAIGIAQFMPQTAQGLGLNPYDPTASLKAAAAYDARNLNTYKGDYQKMLAAYNAGGGAVNTAVLQHGNNWLSYMPTETQNYVANIMKGRTLSTSNNTSTSTGNAVLDIIKIWGEYIVIFILAVLLIVMGLYMLNSKFIQTSTKQVAKAAML